MARTFAIFRHNVRLLIGDPTPIVIFIVAPLIVMTIMRPASRALLVAEGFPNANGAEQVVPGFSAMFLFFWIGFVGRGFFLEHGWRTWDRVLTSSARPWEVIAGKLLPAATVMGAQLLILFAAGALILGLDSEGPLLALVPIGLGLIACVLSLTMALVATMRTFGQVQALTNLFTLTFAALGGSLVPLFTLPEVAGEIAPATPTYWALKASQEVLLEGDGLSAVLVPTGVLFAFALSFAILAEVRFRIGEAKRP